MLYSCTNMATVGVKELTHFAAAMVITTCHVDYDHFHCRERKLQQFSVPVCEMGKSLFEGH